MFISLWAEVTVFYLERVLTFSLRFLLVEFGMVPVGLLLSGGGAHGVAIVVHRLWHQTGLHLNKFFAWLITFNFVNIAWIFFRADSVKDAVLLVRKMFDLSWCATINADTTLRVIKLFLNGSLFSGNQCYKLLLLDVGTLLVCLVLKNIRELKAETIRPNLVNVFFVSGVLWYICRILFIQCCENVNKIDFLYWQF